jgi:enoyl-CoA hydratase/carnithine racemase
MAYEFIKVDREGPVTIFTLNRPEVMNALHSPASPPWPAACTACRARSASSAPWA